MTTRTAAILLAGLLAVTPARAQESAPVTVDASPSAAELLRRAEEAAAANPAESARLVQQVLDGFARKLVPWPPEPDRYRSAAAAAEDFLRERPAVRERWLRQEAPTAERAVAAGELVETVRARAGTPAALQAMLALAQRAMDEGRTFEARAWIARAGSHPMVDDALRARLAGAMSALEAVDRVPQATRVPRPVDEATAVWQPLWTVPLPTAWLARTSIDLENGLVRRLAASEVADGSALSMQPCIDGDAVLVADGAFVHALDRYSGSVLWRAQVGSGTDRSAQPLGDLVVAVPTRDLVVTLPGHAQPEQRSGTPRIVALERSTGRRRWEASLAGMQGPEFEDLFPHGEPVAVGDLVVVQARKSNSRLESAAWLVALDAASGDRRWAVPLGAAGGMRLAASRPLGSPVALGDDLIAATSLGVVTRLDGATGETRWLRRWPAPTREPRIGSPAWQLPSPVADDRLVAWLAPDAATLVGLDPADGRTLWTLALGVDTPYGAARTLLLSPDRLLAIGDDVVALDRADPRTVVWSLSRTLGKPPSLRGAASLGTLADGSPALVVPTADAVLLVRPSDGAPLGSWTLAGGANTALADGQLAACGAQSVSLAMQATEGERILRERLAADPADPRRGIALLELGRVWKRQELVRDGAQAASAALQAAPEPDAILRDELVRRLIDRTTLESIAPAEAERLLQFAAEIARTPGQRAEVALTRAGRAAAEGQATKAADMLRSLLRDEALRCALVRLEPSRSVAAGVIAARELATAGDAAARAQLDALSLPARPDRAPEVGGLRAEARALAGSLVEESEDALAERPTDAVLVHGPLDLSLWRAPALEPAWRVPFASSRPVVASWRTAIVLWAQAGPDDGRLVALDPNTGRTRFQIDGVASLFETGGGDAADRGEVRAIDAFRAGDFMMLQRGDGRTVGLRIDGDGAVAWRHAGPIRLVRSADADAERFVLVGDGADDLPEIVVGRVSDGTTWLEGRVPAGIGRPMWTRLVPQGVAIGGSDGVAVLDLAPGLPLRWLQQESRARGNDALALAGGTLLLTDGQRRPIGVALEDGQLRTGFLQGASAESDTALAAVSEVGGSWLAHRLHSLRLHGGDGALQGEAVGAPGRQHDAVVRVRDGVISAESVVPDLARGASQGPEFAVRRHVVSQGLRQDGPPVVVQGDGMRIARMQAIEGWVLLGGDDRTIAIPASAGREGPR